jgi:succinoglycan biosynthesis transport protein ExoP
MTSSRLEDRDLADAIRLLWARRFRLLLVVAIAGGIALVGSMSLPKTYRATATLVISDTKLPATEGRADARYADTYAALLKSPTVSTTVIKELDLGRRLGTTPTDLSNRLAVRSVPNTLLVMLSMDLTDPALAAEIVNAHARGAVELSRTMATTDMVDLRGYLQKQVAQSREELRVREAELRRVQGEARVEGQKERLKALLEVRGAIEKKLTEAEQDAAGSEQAAKSIRAALGGQSRILTLERSVVDDPALREAAAAGQSRTPKELLGLRMQQQQVNPLYEESEPELVKADADAASARARRDAARTQLRANLQEVQAVGREFGVDSTRVDAAQAEYDIAKNAYETISKSYEQSLLSVRAQIPELRLITAAIPDSTPVGPRVAMNVAIVIASSLIFGIFVVLFADYMRGSTRVAAAALASAPAEPSAAEPEVELTRSLHARGTR